VVAVLVVVAFLVVLDVQVLEVQDQELRLRAGADIVPARFINRSDVKIVVVGDGQRLFR